MRTYFPCISLISRIDPTKGKPVDVGLRSRQSACNGAVPAEMADLTHCAHKEGAIGPHRARDVSKDPFGPLGIGGLDLENIGEKTLLTAHATNVQLLDLRATCTIVGSGKSLSP
jgi:hypothetical protein